MRALRILEWHQPPEVVELEMPRPGPGQVVIKVGGAGVCHSDLHIMHDLGDTSPWPLPFTLGHENAGWVHELGAGVTGLTPGQAVAVYGPWGCGACARCRVDKENYCEDPAAAPMPGSGGLGADGGMAEYMVVPDARHLVPLPAGLDPVAAAPLTDAGLTPYHAVRRSWPKLAPTSTAVVIGIGGLGHMAVQILKATTAARIIAVDTKKEALALAASLGADDQVEATDPPTTAATLRQMTGGRGADVVLDCVGSETTLATAVAASRPLGDVTLIGIAGGTAPFGFFHVPYEVSLQSVYWGTRQELVEVLDLAGRGRLQAEISTFPLDAATDAYDALATGAISGRAVVVPNAAP